ncbi:MAG: hypothetical protein JNL49_10570, partial [Bacteroidia bacterium]|nr:hypothetical protein [Bacteroidia bacterium]
MKSFKQNKSTLTGLKRWFTALILVSVFGLNATAQIVVSGGTGATAGSPYGTIGAAISAINTGGALTGPVTVDIPAGYTETLTGKVTLTMTGTVTNTITIQKSGAGANPVFTSYTGTVATPSVIADGFFVLAGCDYVTIDGINLQEAAGNTTTTTVMEYGFGLFKASATDGCQNNTIKNCTITLNRISNTSWTAPGHNGSTGIAVLNGLNTAAGAVTVTAASGSNSFNKIYSNTIQNCNAGIVFVGFGAASPYLFGSGGFGDSGNDVGGVASGTGNTVLNFGGGAATNPATGIFANNQWGMNCSYNTVNNNDGAGVNHATTLRGIFLNASSTSASVDCNNNTVTVKSGGTTSLLVGIDVEFGSTAAGNTINVNNNTVQNCTYSTATSGAFQAILTSTTATNVNVNGNTITNNTHPGTGQTDLLVIASTPVNAVANNNIITNNTKSGVAIVNCLYTSSTPTNFTANNNTISGNSITGASGTLYGIRFNTSIINSNGNTISNLSFPSTSGATASTLYGMYSLSSPTVENFNNNNINNLSISGAGTSTSHTLTGIRTNSIAGSNKNLNNNSISALTINPTGGSGVLKGIHTSTGNTVNVNKNTICNLQASGASSTVSGIEVTSGTTVTVSNNRIGELLTQSANAANPLIGINITGGGTINTYYNTVNLNASSSGALFGSSAVSVSSTPTVTLRNNIFVNTSTANGAGLTVAHRRSTTTLTSYGASSSQNMFYSTGSYFTDGTNTDATFAAYKFRVAPRDAASVSETPNFLSTTCGNSNFLKINTSIPTQMESSAGPIAGITDDFEGDIRNVTTPDIGADEFAGIASDITGPAISYSVIANTACLTDITLSAIITDASLVNSAPGTKPRLYFKKSVDANAYVGNTNADNGWKYVEATNASSPFSFTTNYSLLQSAVVPTDVIEYFVVAQDLAGTPNISINNGTFASAPSSVALTAAQFPITGIPNSYVINNTIPTSVTIGVAGTYPTLTGVGGLFEAINNNALAGNTVATILDASITEPGTVALNQINYGCSIYTLTISPLATTTLTGSVAAGSIIKLNGADYVTIDGSNSGGTDRSLTIRNTTTTTSGNAVVWLASPASGNGSTNNVIKNCIIEGNSSTTSFTGIHIGGSTTVGLTTAGTERNSNNTIQNNLFRKTIYGLTMFGYTAGTPDLNNVITQNNFGTATAGEGFSLLAINADRQQNLVVSYNEVQNVRNATNVSSTPYGGIRLLDFKDGQCYNNNIHDLDYTGASTPKIYGIAVTSSSYTTVGNPSNALIYNNTVSRITSTGISSVWNLTGILASAGYGDKFYHNTVHLTGQLNNSSSGLSAAFANGDGNVSTVCTNIDVRNNIFNVEGSSLGGNVWAYYSAATTLAGSTLNYNNLRCAGTGATNNVGRFNAVNYTSLAAWQTATGQEANSVSIAPVFTSNTDLHLDLGSNSSLDNLGTPLAAVTVDIDGTTRSVTTPDMGADEFAALTCSGAIGGTASGSTTLCNSGTPSITATGYSIGAGSGYQWMSSTNAGDYPLAGTPIGGQTNPATLTTGVVSTTTYYWLVVTCTSGLATDYSTMVTVTVTPSAASVTGASSKCANDPAVTLTENGGTGTSWLWSTSETTQSISVNPSSTTTYTVTVTSPGPCTATATKTVTVIANPSGVTASASASSICNGSSIDLNATSNPGSVTTVFSENFNSTTAGTTTSGNLPAGWSGASLTSGVRIWGVVASAQSGSTIGGGNFLYCESDVYTAFQTRAEVVTPVINLAGYTSVNIKFKHYYNDLTAGSGTDSARVYVSNDGGANYTLVQAYDTDQGTAFTGAGAVNATLPVGITLTNNMKIKLVYNSDAGGNDWYWAVDDFIVEGIPSNTYAWTSTPSGFTSAVQNPTGVTPTVSTDYTVTVTGVGGCTATASTGLVTVNNYPVADAPANVTACDSYVLPALSVGNYFSGTNGTGTAYSAGNTITASMTMYVYAETGTTPNCTDENSFTITINNTPVADAPANVTACDSYVLPALSVGNYFSGTNGTGTAYSAGNTITASMTMYVYAETGTTPNCTDENSFTITINTSPTATISGDASICSGNATNLTLNFTGVAPWTYAINGGAPATTSNNPETVSVSPVANTVYTITSLSDANCSGSGSGSATINVTSGPPTFLTSFQSAPASACNSNVVTVTLNPVAGATDYTWSAPAGTLINGQAGPLVTTSNSVTLTLGALPANSSGWSICVIASNPCGTSQNKCVSIRGALSTPSVISGPKTACPSTSVGYSVNPVAGANSYIWTGTGGITFTGSGTSVTANFPGGFTSGNICVAAQLSCGYTGGARCMTVSTSVPTLGAMTGPFAVCPGQTNLVYSIPAVAGAATYNWTIPNNVTVNSGLGTNSVNVSIGSGFNIGNICVNVTSICGVVSPSRCNSISSVKPYTPGNI